MARSFRFLRLASDQMRAATEMPRSAQGLVQTRTQSTTKCSVLAAQFDHIAAFSYHTSISKEIWVFHDTNPSTALFVSIRSDLQGNRQKAPFWLPKQEQ